MGGGATEKIPADRVILKALVSTVRKEFSRLDNKKQASTLGNTRTVKSPSQKRGTDARRAHGEVFGAVSHEGNAG